MTNNEARILDHTTATFSEELAPDWCGEMVSKVVTIEGIPFTLDSATGYMNVERNERLYMEGSDEDWTDIWYAQTDPMEG